ncbi:MAG: lipopolysaccharide transport periplasmic protein LptA [Proteobacteria bacterium]|nr:lipopolysaccharide transport periplasmic protein LptA [Pseudomonadota bacterium]
MRIVRSIIHLNHCGITLAALLLCGSSYGQIDELVLPISLDADSTDYDGKSSMLMFRGLRLTQGSIGIEADEGRASKLDFEDSVWHFAGNVVIDTENAHIESDTADLKFTGHVLRLATITGSPATFEMKRPNSNKVTYAEAGRLEYDFDAGVVEFSDQATITEGGNQISSNYLVYNIKEQRINARSGGEGDPRVRITYTPGTADDATAGDAAAESEEIQDQPGSQDSQGTGDKLADEKDADSPETTGDIPR